MHVCVCAYMYDYICVSASLHADTYTHKVKSMRTDKHKNKEIAT